jgi:hypothetical protein
MTVLPAAEGFRFGTALFQGMFENDRLSSGHDILP